MTGTCRELIPHIDLIPKAIPLLLMLFWIYAWGLFLDGPENVSHPEIRSKISKLTITELFYSHILSINRGSILCKKFQACNPLGYNKENNNKGGVNNEGGNIKGDNNEGRN